MKTTKLIYIILILLFFYNCKNTAQNETQPTSTNSIRTKVIVEKVKNSNRLTEKSLLSHFPKIFLGQKFNGETHSKTSKPDAYHGGIKYDFIQLYGEVGDISITITDYSDSQGYIDLMKKHGKKDDSGEHSHGSFRVYKDASGLYISEYLNQYQGKLNRSTLVISNPRFDITIDSRKQRINAYKPEVLLKGLKKTNLFKLFDLPIPDKAVLGTQLAGVSKTAKKVLNCDEILPMSVVKTICNKTVSIKTTSFEKEYNCNRFYPDKNSTGALIFMVTQYSRAPTAKSAVKIDNGKVIPNLGDNAIYIKEKLGSEYLKVSYKNYLLELRSVKNFDKEGVCYTEKELVKLMKGIIGRL